MTLSKHGDKQICSISRVFFFTESPTPSGIPKHLDIMVYKAIGLRVDVFQYHLSQRGKLEQMDKVIYRFIGFNYWLYLSIGFIYRIWWLYLLDLFIRFIYQLYLFIGFIYSIWWLYLLDLFIRFIYQLYLFIGFIYSIWWLYLLDLSIDLSFSVYSIHSHSNAIQIFSQLRRECLTFLSLYISHVLTEKIFRFSLRHHQSLINLTFLQLHHGTSLIKLKYITSLHHNYYTWFILTLHYSNIISHDSVSLHLQIPLDIQLLHLTSFFISILIFIFI